MAELNDVYVMYLPKFVLWNEWIKELDDGIFFECLIVADLSDNGNGCIFCKSFQTFLENTILKASSHSISCCWTYIINWHPSLFTHVSL